jgi:hypothetical protein
MMHAKMSLNLVAVLSFALLMGACASVPNSTAPQITKQAVTVVAGTCDSQAATNSLGRMGDGGGARSNAASYAGDGGGASKGRSGSIIVDALTCGSMGLQVSGASDGDTVLVTVDGEQFSVSVDNGAFDDVLPISALPTSVTLTAMAGEIMGAPFVIDPSQIMK